MDVLILKYKVDEGEEGVDSDPANPLSRALNQLFNAGQPLRTFANIFLTQPVSEGEENNKLRWLGTFVLSQGNRVIFFPGLTTKKDRVELYKGERLITEQDFVIDHLSLEKDLKSWHFTSPQSKDHLGSIGTADLGDGRRLWFGMSFSDFSVLRLTNKITSIEARSPESDSERRKKVFKESIKNDYIIQPHPNANKTFLPGIFHLSVIAGPCGFNLYQENNHGFPVGSPFLQTPLPERIKDIPIRFHRITLSDDIELQVSIAKLPGALNAPITFTSNR